MTTLKPAESLTVADLAANPIWQFVNRDELGETCVRAVRKMPVQNLRGMLVGTQVYFANGTQRWAIIGNVHAENPRLTELFLTLGIEQSGKWFPLARYFDSVYSRQGPEGLAQFLGLQVDEVFPISFDLRAFSRGDPAALAGRILKEPRERLSRAEITALAVRNVR